MKLWLKDRVAIVTGSGRGIGKAVAKFFAREGAQVVVNDLGVEQDGSGRSSQFADEAVAEIRKDGGNAVANYDTVITQSGAQNIVKTAINNFGRADILINNAGIFQITSFVDISEDEWDSVITAHLRGHFNCTRAVMPYMIKQKYGRIINISSGAALGTVKGTVHYSSAKAGVLGFTRSLAMEVKEYGITVNAVMPVARTRMIDIVTREMSKGQAVVTPNLPMFTKTPESNAPLMAFLASEAAGDITGFTFASRFDSNIDWISNPSALKSVAKEGMWTVAELAEKIPQMLKS